MGRKASLILGCVVFMGTIVALAPAAVAYRWLAPAEVRLSGVDGTLWQGNARLGSVDTLGFQDLEWQLKPSRLLLGQLAATLSLKLGEGFLDGNVATGLTRQIADSG